MAVSDERLLLLDRRLAALRRCRPALGRPLECNQALLRAALLSPRPPTTYRFPLPREHVAARIRAGVPMLADQPVQIDVHFAADLFSRLTNVLQQHEDAELQAGLDALVEATAAGSVDHQRLFHEAFVRHTDHLAEMALELGVDAELLITLAGQAVAPLQRAYADGLLPMVERVDDGSPDGAVWRRGYCPICGAWPALGERRGLEAALRLRCAACGSSWCARPRVCPFCANAEVRSLSMLIVHGERRSRALACNRCQRYLKIRDVVDPSPSDLLSLEDLASASLDALAAERGYRRPAHSGFRIELAVPEEAWLDELDQG